MARTAEYLEITQYASRHATGSKIAKKIEDLRKSSGYKNFIKQHENVDENEDGNGSGINTNNTQSHLTPLDEKAIPSATYSVGRTLVLGKNFAEGIKPHNAKLEPSE